MPDILMHYYRQAMEGLTPNTLMYMLQYHVDMNEIDRKMKENNTKSILNKDYQGDNQVKLKIGYN